MNTFNRRRFLLQSLKGIVLSILACIPGTFFHAHSLLARTRSTAPSNSLKKVLLKTTRQNVAGVLKSSSLSQENKVAVLAVRQLGSGEVKKCLSKLREMVQIVSSGCGDYCGNNCGTECGDTCGNNCGNSCNLAPGLSSGVFCGGGCRVQPGTIGVLDQAGRVGIDFRQVNTRLMQRAVQEALHLVR